MEESSKGLWANIRAKKARGEKPARKGSVDYKKAVSAAKRINAMDETDSYCPHCLAEFIMENYNKLNEAEYQGRKVDLNKPMRSSGPKKYKVYVKNPKTGRVMVVHFGDVSGGLKAKVSDPEARKRFASRHNCKMKKDKTKAGYWACRANRYASLWGGKTYPGYW